MESFSKKGAFAVVSAGLLEEIPPSDTNAVLLTNAQMEAYNEAVAPANARILFRAAPGVVFWETAFLVCCFVCA